MILPPLVFPVQGHKSSPKTEYLEMFESVGEFLQTDAHLLSVVLNALSLLNHVLVRFLNPGKSKDSALVKV